MLMLSLPHTLLFVLLLLQEQDKTICSTNYLIVSRNTESTFDSWNWVVFDENYGQSSIVSLEGQYFLLITVGHNLLLSLVQKKYCGDAWEKLDFLSITQFLVSVMKKILIEQADEYRVILEIHWCRCSSTWEDQSSWVKFMFAWEDVGKNSLGYAVGIYSWYRRKEPPLLAWNSDAS